MEAIVNTIYKFLYFLLVRTHELMFCVMFLSIFLQFIVVGWSSAVSVVGFFLAIANLLYLMLVLRWARRQLNGTQGYGLDDLQLDHSDAWIEDRLGELLGAQNLRPSGM